MARDSLLEYSKDGGAMEQVGPIFSQFDVARMLYKLDYLALRDVRFIVC